MDLVQSSRNVVDNDVTVISGMNFSNKDRDKETGLLGTKAFETFVKTILLQKSGLWVLSMLNIDDLKHWNDNFTHNMGDIKIAQCGSIIKDFCEQMPQRMKAFKHNKNKQGKGDIFAILFDCESKNKNKNQKRKGIGNREEKKEDIYKFARDKMFVLIEDIFEQTQVKVSVGMIPFEINKIKTMESWILACLNNIKIAKKNGGKQFYFSKFDNNSVKKLVISKNDSKEDEKMEEKEECKLGDQAAFKSKIQEICGEEDTDWVLALIDCDNVRKFIEKYDNSFTDLQVRIIKEEIIKICNIYDSNVFGYHLGNGDEFALVINDSFDEIEENWDFSFDIIQTLMDNIREVSLLTISVGLTRLENEELAKQWQNRCDKYLQNAKDQGRDRINKGQIKKQKVWLNTGIYGNEEKKSEIGANSVIGNNDNICINFPFECEISFEDIYDGVSSFYYDNNKLKNVKFGNNCIVSNCNNKNKNETNETSFIYICEKHRHSLQNELYETCHKKQCLNKSIQCTIGSLGFNDDNLILRSKRYQKKEKWFICLYCYLRCFKEIIETGLTSNEIISNQLESNPILYEYLFSLHLNLIELLEISVLFECFFDWAMFISIFCPLFEPILSKRIYNEIFEEKNKKGECNNNEDVFNMRTSTRETD